MKFGVVVFPGSNCDQDSIGRVTLAGVRNTTHPERAAGCALGSEDGFGLFESILKTVHA